MLSVSPAGPPMMPRRFTVLPKDCRHPSCFSCATPDLVSGRFTPPGVCSIGRIDAVPGRPASNDPDEFALRLCVAATLPDLSAFESRRELRDQGAAARWQPVRGG